MLVNKLQVDISQMIIFIEDNVNHLKLVKTISSLLLNLIKLKALQSD